MNMKTSATLAALALSFAVGACTAEPTDDAEATGAAATRAKPDERAAMEEHLKPADALVGALLTATGRISIPAGTDAVDLGRTKARDRAWHEVTVRCLVKAHETTLYDRWIDPRDSYRVESVGNVRAESFYRIELTEPNGSRTDFEVRCSLSNDDRFTQDDATGVYGTLRTALERHFEVTPRPSTKTSESP